MNISSVCLFCGSGTGNRAAYGVAAARLGRILAASGIRMIFGAGSIGLMGIAARAALEAGGEVYGIIPAHLNSTEISLNGLTRLEVVDSMHERKRRMFDYANAFVVLPGGIGTLDEILEVITWRQLGLHNKPIVIVDCDNYWQPLIDLFEHCRAREFVGNGIFSLFHRVDTVDAAVDLLTASELPQPHDESKLI